MRRARQKDVIEPEGDGSEGRARGDHGTRYGERILPQKVDRLRPVANPFPQSHLDLIPSFSSDSCSCETK